MSDCSTQAMAPKEQPKTCGTCANFVKEPYKQHAGACMASYKECPVSGYFCVSDMWRCEWPEKYREREDEIRRLSKWAFDSMEGCDEPEFSLFSSIWSAVGEYREGRTQSDALIMGMPMWEACEKLKRYADLERIARELYGFMESDYPESMAAPFRDQLRELEVEV